MLAVVLITVVGVLARYYIGKRMIEWVDTRDAARAVAEQNLRRHQAGQRGVSGNKNSFKTVVLVEFPRDGNLFRRLHHQRTGGRDASTKPAKRCVCVFVPTTPNPTSGFLILVPEEKVTKLDMTVADGIKYIISLGSISQEYTPVAEKRG